MVGNHLGHGTQQLLKCVYQHHATPCVIIPHPNWLPTSWLAVSSSGSFPRCIASNQRALFYALFQFSCNPVSFSVLPWCLWMLLVYLTQPQWFSCIFGLRVLSGLACSKTQNAAACADTVFTVCRHHGVSSASGHCVFLSLCFLFVCLFVSLRAHAFWRVEMTTAISYVLQLDTPWVSPSVCAGTDTWCTRTHTKVALVLPMER